MIAKPIFRQMCQRSLVSRMLSTRIYNWGTGTNGQLGHAKYEEISGMLGPMYVQDIPRKLFKSNDFIQIACGVEFTIGLTNRGELFGWGTGYVADKKSLTPDPIPIPIKMTKIAAGARHCAAIGEDGLVYTWGKEGTWMKGGGQLGHGDRDPKPYPKLVDAFQQMGVRAQAVCCGGGHTHILTTDGEVLSCGMGEYGRLGLGSTSDALIPTPVDSLVHEDIKQIVSGQSHSLALTEDGRVYSWGKNDNGQLGTADSFMDMYSMEAFPTLLDASESFGGHKIKFLAAGKSRSAAVTEGGELFIWGHKLTHIPTLIPASAFEGQRVMNVVCGGEIGSSGTAVITEDSTLWTFGNSRSYLLARKDVTKEVVFIEKPIPERVEFFKDRKVLDVFAGLGQHMAALVEEPLVTK